MTDKIAQHHQRWNDLPLNGDARRDPVWDGDIAEIGEQLAAWKTELEEAA